MEKEGLGKAIIEVPLIEELEEILKMNIKSRWKFLLIEETLKDVKERLGVFNESLKEIKEND